MRDKTNYQNGGYSLIETLFYVSLFTILTLAVIHSLIIMTQAFRTTSVQADLVRSSFVVERISREIRQAYGINSISASDLKLNTKDELGNNKTVRFLLSGSDVQIFEDDVLVGNLNTSNAQVTSLSFVQITTTLGQAVKVSLGVRSARDKYGIIEDFYDTVVLRGAY